jgi:acetoin utilization deacetylase AcuC-like enzyme
MELRLVADECCHGRLAVVTEGGYDLRSLAESLQATIQALTDKGSRSPHWPSADSSSTRRGTAAVAAVRESLARYWRI